MATPIKNSKDTKTTLHIVLAHLLGAPGYIVWITGWLFLIVMALSALGTRSNVIPESGSSSGLDIFINPQPLNAFQGLLSMVIILAIWYAIASVLRKGVWYLCNKRANPERAWLVLMLGGAAISWLAIGTLLYLTGANPLDIAVLLSLPLFVSIIGLSLEAILVHHWKLEQ